MCTHIESVINAVDEQEIIIISVGVGTVGAKVVTQLYSLVVHHNK